MHRHSQMQLQPRMRAQLILDSLMPLSLSLCHHVSFFLGFDSKLQLLRLILLQKFMHVFHQCVTLCREPFLIVASEVLLKHLLISERVAWQVLKSPPSDHRAITTAMVSDFFSEENILILPCQTDVFFFILFILPLVIIQSSFGRFSSSPRII